MSRSFARAAASLLASVALMAAAAHAQPPPPPSPLPVAPDTWTATDALGRTLPTFAEAGPTKPDHTVGMFYFLWLGEHGSAGPFDNAKTLEKDPDAMSKPDSPLWGPVGAPHHWGESEFGYYRSDDPFVLRKHAQMLADASVDTVVFDVTNQLTYPRSWRALGDTWTQVRKEGGRTPQFAFLCPFGNATPVVQTLYEDLYKPGLYADLWFRWEGKPLILADPAAIRADRLRASQRAPGLLRSGETYGQSFTADKPFTAIGGSLPTYASKDSAVTVALYAGDGPPSGKAKPLAEKRFTNLHDNATDLLTFTRPLPPGAYYLEIRDPKGQVGWWSETGNVYAGGRAWDSGNLVRGARTLFVRWADVAAPPDSDPVALWTAKPLDPEAAEAEAAAIRAFFTFRKPIPSYFTGSDGPAQWGWLEVTPQKPFFRAEGDAQPEEVPVGVAQNAVDGKLSVLSNPRSAGRSFHNGAEPPPEGRDFTGRNFAEQWDRAMALDPRFVFVTGWNEWIAGRFDSHSPFYAAGNLSFVDEFNPEFSRDIEPVVGYHTDDYYYQLVAAVRRYKGMTPPPPPVPTRTQPLPFPPRTDDDWNQWRAAGQQWSDDPFDAPARDHPGWAEGSRYTQPAGTNDFVRAGVTHDATGKLCLYVRTREPIRDADRPGHLTVLLAPGLAAAAGTPNWDGFTYVLNRRAGVHWTDQERERGTVTLERRTAGGGWETISDAVPCTIRGAEMAITLPCALLALPASPNPFTLDIKWADGIDWEADPLNLYRAGDTAPDGRFRYHYEAAPSP